MLRTRKNRVPLRARGVFPLTRKHLETHVRAQTPPAIAEEREEEEEKEKEEEGEGEGEGEEEEEVV